jgi:type IV pilus assembly protein PilV
MYLVSQLPVSLSCYQSRNQRTHGFSLIEVLLTVLLVIVGIVAVVKLQSASLQVSKDSRLLGYATLAANSMIDRMRSSKLDSTIVDSNGRALAYEGTISSASSLPTCYPTCQGTDLVLADKSSWFDMMNNHLPAPSATITWQDLKYYTLEITWRPTGIAGQPTVESYKTEFQL